MLQLVTVSVQYAWRTLHCQSKFAACHVAMCFTAPALLDGLRW